MPSQIPLPAALIGLAVGWLVLKFTRGKQPKSLAAAPAGPFVGPETPSPDENSIVLQQQASPSESANTNKRPALTEPYHSPESQKPKIKALKLEAPQTTPPPSPGSSAVEEEAALAAPEATVEGYPATSSIYTASGYSPISSIPSQSAQVSEPSLFFDDTQSLPSPLTLVSTGTTEDDEKMTNASEEFVSPIQLERSGSFTRFNSKMKGGLQRLSSIGKSGRSQSGRSLSGRSQSQE